MIFNTASLEDAFEDESSIAGFGSVEVTFTDGTGSGVWMQDEEVRFIGIVANGEEDTETTTELTLSFDKAITGLSAGDITITTPDGARGTKPEGVRQGCHLSTRHGVSRLFGHRFDW